MNRNIKGFILGSLTYFVVSFVLDLFGVDNIFIETAILLIIILMILLVNRNKKNNEE